MKKYNVLLIVMLSTAPLSVFSMERPPRLVSPNKAEGNPQAPVFVTMYGRSLRARYVQEVSAAVDGRVDIEPAADPAQFQDSSLMEASPEVLVEELRVALKEQCYDYLSENHGITFEKIAAQIPAARAKCSANKENLAHYSPPSTPVKKVVKKIAERQLRVPLDVRKVKEGTDTHADSAGQVAFCTPEGIMGYMADELEALAPTPKSKEKVFEHEDTHDKNQDVLVNIAIELAFRADGLTYSPGVKNQIRRAQEVIADAKPAGASPASAAATLRIAERMKKLYGAGVPTEHPSNDQRIGLAALMCDLHAEHEKELDRKRHYESKRSGEAGTALRAKSRRLNQELGITPPDSEAKK